MLTAYEAEGFYQKIYRAAMMLSFPLIIIFFRAPGLIGLILGPLSLMMLLIYMTYQAIVLCRRLPGTVPQMAFWFGICVVAGASLLDLGVTLWCSFNLNREGNYMVLMLFDLQVSLGWMHFFLCISQIVCVAFLGSLWACFLKTYPQRMYEIPYKSMGTTLRWLVGAGQSSWFQWCLNRKTNVYFSLCFCTIIAIFIQLSRGYIALEWLEIIPISMLGRSIVVMSLLLTGTLILVSVTHYKLKMKKAYEAAAC